MSWKLRILPEVADDLREARDWYEQRRQSLGGQFEENFYSSIARISQIADNDAVNAEPQRRRAKGIFARIDWRSLDSE